MAKLPKLHVKSFPAEMEEDIRDFEQGKEFPFLLNDSLILVEGQAITSYDELVKIAAQDSYRNRELLDVVILNYSLPDGG